MRVSVIGAGSWGTTVAALATQNADEVVLWARRAELAGAISTRHQNPDYLPGRDLPLSLEATSELEEALDRADVVVLAVPSHGFRAVLAQAVPFVPAGAPLVSLAKGLEAGSLLRMTQVVHEVLGDRRHGGVGVLTGPNIAGEVIAGMPTASVVAMGDPECAALLQRLFMTGTFRVYTNPDVVGCEIAGVLKNVVAIAAGIAQGLGCGDNARAALITRSLVEIGRLVQAAGGDARTVAGLAGLGDVIATCTSRLSRNRRAGELLARGRTVAEVLAGTPQVVEGVPATAAALELGARHGVDLPVCAQVGRVLSGASPVPEAVGRLMGREATVELEASRPSWG
jgi:glycerol-3-phosphate dehydrogenase (NAD(P)+)